MSFSGMPFLVMNYGGEMVYILEQRLHAQNIQNDKSAKVLLDVTKAMFAPSFVQELLRPQELYTAAATREIFDRLAHSSIMRLSENSMDKLYDLMTMGLKYQIVACRHPKELIDVTLNHMEAIQTAVGVNATQVAAAHDQMVELCKSLTVGELADVRHALCRFFQDKKVKVSLFLQDKMQNTDGSIILKAGGQVSSDPPVAPVGTIRYFDNGQQSNTVEFWHPNQEEFNEGVMEGDAFDAAARDSQLGKNLYTVSKKKDAPPAAPKGAAPKERTLPVEPKKPLPKRQSQQTKATSELNSLSSLIAPAPPKETVKINLFNDPDDGTPAPAGAASSGGANVINISKVSREDLEKANTELMGVISDMGGAAGQGRGGPAPPGDDLLDLMDGAS